MRDQHHTKRNETENETPLQGWKEIAAYLERDQRTARRWEAEEGLPVRRYRSDRRSAVYAYPSEIEAWRTSRPVSNPDSPPTQEPSREPSRATLWSVVAVALLLAGFLYVLRSPELNPFVEAQSGIVTTEIFHGDVVGKISPDGRYLSDADWTSLDVAIRDLQTGELRRLGEKESFGESDASIFSFDGQQIAYNWLVGDSGNWHYELRIVDALAENPQPRVAFSDPDVDWIEPEVWTRDGRILVWVSSRTEAMRLAFLSLDSGELQTIRTFDGELAPFKVGGQFSAALSPDEAWVAYDAAPRTSPSGMAPQPDVYLISLEDNSEMRVTTRPAADRVAGFAPDNRTLLFFSDRAGSVGLWGVSFPDAGEPQLLLRDLGDANPLGILEDGSVVYSRSVGSRDLVSAEVDVETGRLLRPARLLETQQLGSNVGPWFSPDESKFVYFTGSEIAGQHLFLHDVTNGTERELPTGGVPLQGLIYWSPSGDRLLTSVRKEDLVETFEIDVDTGEIRTLHAGPANPAHRPMGWLADGASILFRYPKTVSLLRPGDADPQPIYRIDAGLVQTHAISPRRDRVVWRENSKDELLKVMPVEGGEARTVAQGAVDYPGKLLGIALNWTSDGNALLTSHMTMDANSQDELWIHPVDGGQPVKLELSDFRIRNAAMLKDGKTIVYQRGNTDPRIFRTQNFLPAADAE